MRTGWWTPRFMVWNYYPDWYRFNGKWLDHHWAHGETSYWMDVAKRNYKIGGWSG